MHMLKGLSMLQTNQVALQYLKVKVFISITNGHTLWGREKITIMASFSCNTLPCFLFSIQFFFSEFVASYMKSGQYLENQI